MLSQGSGPVCCIFTTEFFLLKSTSDTTVKRVSLLSDMHLRNIRTKLLLMSRNHEATKHLEVSLSLLQIPCGGSPVLTTTGCQNYHYLHI